MAADYATLEDLRKHWPTLPAEEEQEAQQKLHEASVEVRALYPELDGRIASQDLDPDVPRMVVCRMVKRAMTGADLAETPAAGMAQFTVGTGPFSFTGTPRSPDGSLYLSGADKRLLSSRRNKRPFTTLPTLSRPAGRW